MGGGGGVAEVAGAGYSKQKARQSFAAQIKFATPPLATLPPVPATNTIFAANENRK